MTAQGLGIAVVGLANQLLTSYNLLSTARSFGRDYGDLDFRLKAEKFCLERWAEAWALDLRSRSDDEQRFAIVMSVGTNLDGLSRTTRVQLQVRRAGQ